MSTCAWDASRKCKILLHVHARGKPATMSEKPATIFGFELGNEMAAGGGTVSSDRTPEQMLKMFQDLAAMIDEIWADEPASNRPKLIGPDGDFSWPHTNATTVLRGLQPRLHAFTYHEYGGGGQTDARAFDTTLR